MSEWLATIIRTTYSQLYNEIMLKVDDLWPKFLWAFLIILIGWVISRLIYLFVIYIFKRFKIIELINKFEIQFESEIEDWIDDITEKDLPPLPEWEKIRSRLSEKIKIDIVVAKSFSYYVFIIFFRISISYIWITEVEKFLHDLILYLPNLFIGVVIGFFWVRFARFIHDVIYHALTLTKEKTSKIIAVSAEMIVLFFTLMLMLDYIKIVDKFIINTILIGFIAMLSISWWLAFWLGWKDIAKEILESFRKW